MYDGHQGRSESVSDWRNMKAVMIKEFRELLRDKRTLAMLILMPVLLLFIFGYAANFSVDKVSVIVIGENANQYAEKLEKYDAYKDGMTITSIDEHMHGRNDAETLLRDRKADAVITVKGDAADKQSRILGRDAHAYIDGSGLFAAQSARKTVLQLTGEDMQQSAKETKKNALKTQQEKMRQFEQQLQEYQLAAQQAAAKGQPAPPKPQLSLEKNSDMSEKTSGTPTNDANTSAMTIFFNPDLKTSFVMIPGLIGLIITLIGTMITSIGLVREREQGTLEQLAVMPLRPFSIIIGKIAPYFLLALVDMAIITILGIWVFGIPFRGNFWIFLLGTVLFLFVVLGMGIFISTISQNSGQAVQMAMMMVMPQMLLGGIIFPLESMAASVRWIGYILPLTWFNQMAQGIMLRGSTWESLWLPVAILTAEAVVLFSLASLKLRRLLTRGGAR